MAIGGAPKLVNIDGRAFRCTGGSDFKRTQGGFKKEHSPNGDGLTVTTKLVPVEWKFEGIELIIDGENGDKEFLDQVRDSPRDVPINVLMPDDTLSIATGTIVGDFSDSSQSSSAAVTFSGGGKYTT